METFVLFFFRLSPPRLPPFTPMFGYLSRIFPIVASENISFNLLTFFFTKSYSCRKFCIILKAFCQHQIDIDIKKTFNLQGRIVQILVQMFVQTIMSRIISVFQKYHCTPTFQLFIQHCQTLFNHSFDFCLTSVKHLFNNFQHCSTFGQILTLPLAATWNLFLADSFSSTHRRRQPFAPESHSPYFLYRHHPHLHLHPHPHPDRQFSLVRARCQGISQLLLKKN